MVDYTLFRIFARMKRYLAFFITLSAALTMMAGNRIYSERFKALTSIVNGDWLNRPVMILGSADKLRIDFDELSHDYHRLTYHIDHCEADWSVSEGVFESDWLSGFNNNQIEDYQNSINTTVQYTHYHLTIPNDRCRLTMSGNYRLTIMDEDADNEKVLEVEFYVVEPLMEIGLQATTNTDIDHNVSHQQLAMTLSYNNVRVNNTDEEIHTVVMQNWREDTMRKDVRPNFVNNKGLAWEHNKGLIFDAGNEYHKFEVLDVSHPTMGIERITWDGHRYQAYPYPSTIRKNYLTDIDADGAFVIRNSDVTEINYTCDYVWVNYELQSPWQGDVYIQGHWTTDAQREHYQMFYDETGKCYRATIMQKQGYYSYQYVLQNGGIPPSEGNFFQTENCYQALVYYKGLGARTWRLVGYRGIVLR